MLLTELEDGRRKIRAWHGSNVPITRFDRKFSAQGVFWFTEDKDKILRGESGASNRKYIIEVILTVSKTAGWDEYEKLMLAQIKNEGYDSINLDDNWIVFSPKNIRIVNVEKADLNESSLFKTQKQLIQYVKNMTDEVDMGLSASNYTWRYESAYSLNKLGNKKLWIAWFNSENRDNVNGWYDHLLYEPFNDPVTVIEEPDGHNDVLDGNHRVGAAFKRGDKVIAAVVGIPKKQKNAMINLDGLEGFADGDEELRGLGRERSTL